MSTESYAESLEGVLKAAREKAPVDKNVLIENNPRQHLLRAAALVAILSMSQISDDRAVLGRQLGPAWSQDHRRTRMGQPNLMESRQKRSTWR
tara:strand:+ start:43 stop:321 length:279 start_codon:yes stop_codon:yes gene_type:complete